MRYLWIYLIAVNVLLFLVMGADKLRSKRGAWRVRERTLFLLALLGGGAGGLLGMFLFRHKTRHSAFVWGFPLLTLLWVGIVWAVIHFELLPR